MKKVLIIGGGRFLGFWVGSLLSSEKFKLTFFNRGSSYNKEISGSTYILGNRNEKSAIDFFSKNRFDVVIDMCAYKPSDLIYSKLLQCDHYIYISSVAVYSPKVPKNSDEGGLKIISNPNFSSYGTESDYNYGELKYLTELNLLQLLQRTLIIRPAIMLGKFDYTNRLSRYLSNSPINIPLPRLPDMPFQYIDALDVANFIVGAIKQDLSGVFNLAGDSISRDEFFSIFAKVQGRKIIESDSKNLSDFPLHEHEIFSNIRTISSNLAQSFGLKFTSVQKTLSHY